jgi:hypothetical protein
MEWHSALTVLPAIGMIFLSFAQFIVSLNSKISDFGKDKHTNIIILLAISGQLRRLGIANSFFYAGALLFLMAGMYQPVTTGDTPFSYLMLFSGLVPALALALLFIHSLKSIQIRQKHLKL